MTYKLSQEMKDKIIKVLFRIVSLVTPVFFFWLAYQCRENILNSIIIITFGIIWTIVFGWGSFFKWK